MLEIARLLYSSYIACSGLTQTGADIFQESRLKGIVCFYRKAILMVWTVKKWGNHLSAIACVHVLNVLKPHHA